VRHRKVKEKEYNAERVGERRNLKKYEEENRLIQLHA
jgi:hypothetical protein